MNIRITTLAALFALFAALICGIYTHTSELHAGENDTSHSKPIRTISIHGDERRLEARRQRVRDPESDFSRYLSKIEPITDFDDTSSGFFEGYLLSREADKIIAQGDHLKNQKNI